MTIRCELRSWIVSDAPPGTAVGHHHTAPHRVEYRCATHNMPMDSPDLPGDGLCAIGRIEAATEKALAAIEAKRTESAG